MPSIGGNCHELRIQDRASTWRIIYRIETDAIVILDVFQKKTSATPKQTLIHCRARLARYLVALE